MSSTDTQEALIPLHCETKTQPQEPCNLVHTTLSATCTVVSNPVTADGSDRIKALFPSTYGRPRIELVPGGVADVFDKPLNMGVVLSGGQAPGGHNVIAGVFDFAKKCSKDSKVYG